MSKKHKKSKRFLFFGYGLMLLCGVVSAYVFLASFETTFNVDIPVVNAAKSIDSYSFTRLLSAKNKVNQSDYGNYGKPVILRIPGHNSKIVLAPAVDKGKTLLARANTAHFLLTSPQKNGNLGNSFVYMNASWRTDSHPEKLGIKDNLFIDTDRDWRYFYRIDAIRELNSSKEYIARDSSVPQLILIARLGDGKIVVIEASFVNVQNVRL